MSEAITLLRNVELKLIKPTERMKDIFVEWGVSSGEAAVRTFGLVGVLEKLRQKSEESGDVSAELGAIFGRLRAIVGASALTMNDYRAEVEKFDNASTRAFEAFEERINSLDTRANRQLAQIKNFFVEDFGTPILRTLVEFSEKMGGSETVIIKVRDLMLTGISVYTSYRVALLATTLQQQKFNTSVKNYGDSNSSCWR